MTLKHWIWPKNHFTTLSFFNYWVGGGSLLCLYFLHVSEHSEHICLFFCFFWSEKLIIFTDGGLPPSHENNKFPHPPQKIKYAQNALKHVKN